MERTVVSRVFQMCLYFARRIRDGGYSQVDKATLDGHCGSDLPIATNLWNREKDGREKPSFQEKTRFREEIGGLGWWAVPTLQRSAAMDSYGIIQLACVGLFEFLSQFCIFRTAATHQLSPRLRTRANEDESFSSPRDLWMNPNR